MTTAEEKFNSACQSATQLLQEGRLEDSFKVLKSAIVLAINTSRFATLGEREKWISRAEQALEMAEEIQVSLSNKKFGQKKNGSAASTMQKDTMKPDGLLPLRPQERFADISGMEEAKTEVRLSVIEPLLNPEKADKYGLRLGGGLLLYGLPGTGKTFFAKAVAGELGLPFYVIKSDDILCKYLGESEKIVKEIFDAARRNPMSVIYIDETNGILPSRSDENIHEVSKRIAEIILQETDGIDSKEKNPFLLIGSTNYPDKIDEAALSRFSVCLEVELPDEATRKFILNKDLGMMKINIADAAIEFLVAQTDGFSCRDLVNLAAYYRKISAKNEIEKFSLDFCKENFKDTHIVSTNVIENIKEFKTRLGQNAIAEKKK